jgi:hypothetical protein
MGAISLYHFQYIAPNTTASIAMSPYGDREAVAQCAVVKSFTGGAPAAARVTLTVGEAFRHADGSMGRTFHVRNHAGGVEVVLLEIVETF